MSTQPARPHITSHAKTQWAKRAHHHERFDVDLAAVFCEGLPVGLPDRYDGKGLLHPPSGTVLLYKGSLTDHPDFITVLVAQYIPDLCDDHLDTCKRCDQRFDPGRGPCPWCAEGDR